MIDRSLQIDNFLAGSRWEHWTRTPLASDASSRRYLRITRGEESAILMDADPATGQDTAAFARIAHWLADQNLAAPEIYLHDESNGLMLLEDLGVHDLARWISAHPADGPELYSAATDVLVHLDGLSPPSDLPVMTPDYGGQMLDVTVAWYAGQDENQTLIQEMTAHLADLCGAPDTVALRDFHAENLIWRPDRRDLARIGLLDFQDAFIAPRGYDLVSLTRDVRREVDPALAQAATTQFAHAIEAPSKSLSAALACLAVQRNLRILGVFARLARRDGKHGYLRMFPHLWAMITDDLQHPALTDLKQVVDAHLPAPAHSAIKDLL